MAEIEAILFDVGGTLRNSTPKNQQEHTAFISRIMEVLDLAGDASAFSRKLTRRFNAYRAWAQDTLVELNEADLWSKWMLPELPREMVRQNAITLNQLYRESTGTRMVDPQTREVVVELFRRGYRLGIVSNTTSSVEVPALVKELEISGLFEVVILSAVEGKRKPDPAILLDAAARMGVAPERCAYVGDRLDRDVAAGRGAGYARIVLIQNGTVHAAGPSPQLVPDHTIQSLSEMLPLFPARNGGLDLPAHHKPVYDVTFSTMWMRKKVPTLQDFFLAAARLGFRKIELNHQMNSILLAQADLASMPVSSIHEPCPADIPLDVLKEKDWLISSLDEDKRIPGVEAVKKSIDLAHSLGADYIVVHAGSVNSTLDLEKRLRHMVEHGQDQAPEFSVLVEELRQDRKRLAPAHFRAVCTSIRELLDYAAPRKVRLGIENRYHFMEFPLPDELEILLGMGGPDQIGFVLDVGHAYTLERLGFFPFAEWLERFSSRIIGTHLHDVIGVTDHYAPGLGAVDFDLVARYLPKEANRVCEFQTINSTEQVRQGLAVLHEHGCIKSL